MIIFNDDFLGIKIAYTNNILVIIKEGEIVYKNLFLERDEMEDFVLEYLSRGEHRIERKKNRALSGVSGGIIGG